MDNFQCNLDFGNFFFFFQKLRCSLRKAKHNFIYIWYFFIDPFPMYAHFILILGRSKFTSWTQDLLSLLVQRSNNYSIVWIFYPHVIQQLPISDFPNSKLFLFLSSFLNSRVLNFNISDIAKAWLHMSCKYRMIGDMTVF